MSSSYCTREIRNWTGGNEGLRTTFGISVYCLGLKKKLRMDVHGRGSSRIHNVGQHEPTLGTILQHDLVYIRCTTYLYSRKHC